MNYQKFGRDFSRELNTRVGALIRFFEGDSREWNFFLPDIRAALTEIANPDMASGAQDDIRKLLTKKQKQELIAWLRSRTDQVR